MFRIVQKLIESYYSYSKLFTLSNNNILTITFHPLIPNP